MVNILTHQCRSITEMKAPEEDADCFELRGMQVQHAQPLLRGQADHFAAQRARLEKTREAWMREVQGLDSVYALRNAFTRGVGITVDRLQ
jgi:hypothetical protein